MTRGARFQDPIIGGVLFHSADDRRAALAALRADFTALANEIHDPSVPATLQAALAPTFAAFDGFYDSETRSTLAPWITEWSVFQAWQERLGWARIAARAAGVPLTSAEPAELPKTVWERGEDGTGTSSDRLLVFGRDAFKLGLGIAAAIGIWKALRHLKTEIAEVEEEIDEEIDGEPDETDEALAGESPIDEDEPVHDHHEHQEHVQ